MICKHCGKEFNGNFCDNCGSPAQPSNQQPNNFYSSQPMPVKKKKPLYKRWWFWVIAIIVVICVANRISDKIQENKKPSYSYSDNSDSDSEYENSLSVTTKAEAKTSVRTAKEQSSKAESDDMIDGMHRDFKEAMDSYEEFFDEYVAFMKKYKESNNSITMLAQYTKFMEQYSETMQKLDEWESKDLNNKETAYLLDVTTRINKKLLEIGE